MQTKNIFLDVNVKNQSQLFRVIAKKCADYSIIESNHQQHLFDALIEREKISSTGFENGFSIPHARIAQIKEPAVFYVRLKSGINWKSIDGKLSQYIIFLLVPESAGNKHLELLSKVALGLMDENFTKVISISKDKNEISNAFQNLIEKEETQTQNGKGGTKKILAITACSVGIAHTYLAAEKLAEAGKQLNYDIKVETHGSIGVKNEFSQKDIQDADLIIIASDIGVDQTRFVGKKIYTTAIKKAITNGQGLIEEAFEKGLIFKSGDSKVIKTKFEGEKKSYFIKHLLSGVSYMIPFIIFGGLMIALALGISQIIYGTNAAGEQITGPPKYSPLWYLLESGVVAFQLMIPILAGFIANSVAGRSAIAPAAIVAMISNTPVLIYLFPGLDGIEPTNSTPLGFLGGIFYGFLIGYSVKWINTWRIHKNITAVMPIFVIPLAVTLFFSLLAIFVINAPISYLMLLIGEALSSIFETNDTIGLAGRIFIGIGMGALFGGMIGFDMGGPVNKIAFVTASSLLTLEESIAEPMGMVAASVSVAPLGMGIATFVYKNHFDKEQRALGASAIAMGAIGISEGAIPFAVADPKRVILSNVIGSAVAGAIAGGLGVTGSVPHGGPIVGVLGAISGNLIGGSVEAKLGIGIAFFFLAIIIGTAVNVLVFGFLLKKLKYNQNTQKAKNESKKIAFIGKLELSKNLNMTAIAQWSMTFLALGFTVSGIAMWIAYGNELASIIDAYKEDALLEFDNVKIIYAAFTLIFGLLLALASFMHSFTYKAKMKESKTMLNA